MLKIITNNQPRLALYGYELPEQVKEDFDYVADIDGSTFLLYQGQYYWLGDFIWNNPKNLLLPVEWQGYINLSSFCGLVIRQHDTAGDEFVLGRFIIEG